MTEEQFEKWSEELIESLRSYVDFHYLAGRNLLVLSLPKNYSITSLQLAGIPSDLHYQIGVGSGDRPLRLYIYR